MAAGTVIDPSMQRVLPALAARAVDDRYRVGLELILVGSGVPVAPSR
jgi:hypothetical protein